MHPEVPPGPPVEKIFVRVEYPDGAYRQFEAVQPLSPVLAVDDSGVMAGLCPGMADPGRHEASVMLMFTGNPGTGGIIVTSEGVILPSRRRAVAAAPQAR